MATLRIAIRVKPGSSRAKVSGAYGPDRQLIVAVSAPPVDGAANDAVLKAVATAFGVRPRHVTLVSGHSARSKVVDVDISDDLLPDARHRLESLLDSAD